MSEETHEHHEHNPEHPHEHGHHGHHHGELHRLPLGTYLLRVVVSVLIIAVLIGYGMTFQVSESENVVVTRFDNPIRVVTEPGLHSKLPWPIDRAHVIDMRKRIFSTPHVTTLTKDKKSIILLTYAVWQVKDPMQFLKSLGTIEGAEKSLESLVVSHKNVVMGKYDLASLVSTDASKIGVEEIERQICEGVHHDVCEKFGVDVLQVGIKRMSFPEENVQAVLDQMSAERQSEATKLRAEGKMKASQIINEAKVASAETIKEGTILAGEITGKATLEAARIRSQTHQLDPKFYQFWRTLQAMRTTVGPRTTLILRNDSGIFQPIFEMPQMDGKLPDVAPKALISPTVPAPTPAPVPAPAPTAPASNVP
ncbi:MAG: protease modulator HflC [Planctomycetia bacterium]|nr:protease modulator HflC [Planctomycetia bacterium]